MLEHLKNTIEIVKNEYPISGNAILSKKYGVPLRYFKDWACHLKVKFDREANRQRLKIKHIRYCDKCKNQLKTWRSENDTTPHLCVSCAATKNNLGRNVSIKTREKMRQSMKGKFIGSKSPMYGKIAYPKFKYVESLKHGIRSSWEQYVCELLIKNNIEYLYEPETFKLIINNKETTYTPDLKIKNYFIEIKGPLFDWQIEKMKEFSKNHNFIIITSLGNFKRLENFMCFDYYDLIENPHKILEIQNVIYK